MTQKAKVKIELDTGPGKAELRKLAKEGEASAGRVNDSMSQGFGRAAALGAVAGAGFGLAQRAASRLAGFIPDAISEGTVGIRAHFDSRFGGPDARAARSAREQTKAAYSEIVGRMKEPQITPEIRNYYNNVRDRREISEKGGAAIDKELGGDILQEALDGLISAISSGFDRIVDALPIGGK